LARSIDIDSPDLTRFCFFYSPTPQPHAVNVAGESQFLDPAGADVLGINVPLGEFLQAGSFETTYLDSEWRISRSKVGPVDQLRVFRKSSASMAEVVDMADTVLDEDFPSDVEWVSDDLVETSTDGEGPDGQDLEEGFQDDDYPSDVEM